jgi:hypothetical protein
MAGILAFVLSVFAIYAMIYAAIERAPMSGREKVVLALFVGTAFVIALTAMFSGSAATERRQAAIAAELAWPKALPFALTGYRDWMASPRGVVVVKLQVEVEMHALVDAVRAIASEIETEVLDTRTFSLRFPASNFCDLPQLKDVFDRLLLPLHADVGIANVTMGSALVRA